MSEYKVRDISLYGCDEWEVVTWIYENGGDSGSIVEYRQHYRGSLADCEAWIRLQESGYLN